MTDPAEVWREGRRLLAEYREAKKSDDPQAVDWAEDAEIAFGGFLWANADVLLADPAPEGPRRDEGWAIAIISNVDAPEVGWPNQTEEWRTAARNWLDSAHDPAPEGLSQEERAHVEPRPADALAAWLVDRWNDDDGYDPSDRVVVAQTIRDFGETRVVWDPQWPGYPEDVLDRLSASPETGEGGDDG